MTLEGGCKPHSGFELGAEFVPNLQGHPCKQKSTSTDVLLGTVSGKTNNLRTLAEAPKGQSERHHPGSTAGRLLDYVLKEVISWAGGQPAGALQ